MSPKVQLAVAWAIAAIVGMGAVGLVTFRFMPHKTEAFPPKTEPLLPKTETLPPIPVPAEDKQAQRWVCSHTTRQTVTILTGVSGAFQAQMDQCDEWKLK
jgi:hypothetical protein